MIRTTAFRRRCTRAVFRWPGGPSFFLPIFPTAISEVSIFVIIVISFFVAFVLGWTRRDLARPAAFSGWRVVARYQLELDDELLALDYVPRGRRFHVHLHGVRGFRGEFL